MNLHRERNRQAGTGPAPVENGTIEVRDGAPMVHFDRYWIRYYAPPPESLAAKKQLIDRLKKRLFHHTEPGINTPGENLEAARCAYENETDPARKRVNGAMLAGALFNRATDIFTTVVDLESKGVKISPDNELMKQCGEYFQEALELGKYVHHYSGHEGVDELWGEPLKAFTLSIQDFYESRYVKIAQTMRDIDCITDKLVSIFADDPCFPGVVGKIRDFGEISKRETETMRSDAVIFEVWPRFVSSGEALRDFRPASWSRTREEEQRVAKGVRLLRDGRALLIYLAGLRTPMAKTLQEFLADCDAYAKQHVEVEYHPG